MHLHYFVQYFYYRVFLMLFTVTTKRVQAQAIVPTINRAFLGIVALVDWKRNKSVLANFFCTVDIILFILFFIDFSVLAKAVILESVN